MNSFNDEIKKVCNIKEIAKNDHGKLKTLENKLNTIECEGLTNLYGAIN